MRQSEQSSGVVRGHLQPSAARGAADGHTPTHCRPETKIGPRIEAGFTRPLLQCAQQCAHVITGNMSISQAFRRKRIRKNRRLRNHQVAIEQVPSSRILTVCGEVAERLKAAVC